MSRHHPRPGVRACHYTTLGMSMQPQEADSEGYLEFRENFRAEIPREDWTSAEALVATMEDRIAEFRRRR